MLVLATAKPRIRRWPYRESILGFRWFRRAVSRWMYHAEKPPSQRNDLHAGGIDRAKAGDASMPELNRPAVPADARRDRDFIVGRPGCGGPTCVIPEVS